MNKLKAWQLRLEHMERSYDLNLLRTFIMVCEVQNLKNAGLRLGLSESAVSKQLSKLSEQLGQPLFVRSSSGLTPTHFSLSVLPQVKLTLRQLANALQPTHFEPSAYRYPIRLAVYSHFLDHFGAAIFQAVHQIFPNALIEMETWSDQTTQKLLNNELDMGIHFYNEDHSTDIWQSSFADDQLVAVVDKQYQGLTWQEVVDWPFIKLRSQGWNHQRFRYLALLEQHGISPNIIASVDNFTASKQMLKLGKIATIMNVNCVDDRVTVIYPPEHLTLKLKLATSTRLMDREAPLQKQLQTVIKQAITSTQQHSPS